MRLTDGVVVLRHWRDEDVEPAALATRDPEIPRWTRVLADWAFAERGLARLELHVDPANAASLRVAEKASFAFEGVLRSYEEIKGVRHDVAIHARLASAPHG